jgi:hypothetical protein
VLIKSMIEAILVYWYTLAHIPKSILEKIIIISFNFLWKGGPDKIGTHLVKWKTTDRIKDDGG